jgi:putative ABC transport system permease protein
VRGASVLQAAWAGTGRRLVQSLVVFAVLAASSAAALIGLTLTAAANQGYKAAITITHAADLAVTIRASTVTAAQLAATRHLSGVTQDAGPYPETTIIVAAGSAATGKPGGVPPESLTVVGRNAPNGPLDDVDANPAVMDGQTRGQSRWPTRPGEISLSTSTVIRLPLGSRLTVLSAPGRPVLTVVGYGDQRQSFEDAWVAPSEVAALRAPGVPVLEQMLYTFAQAGTTAQLAADLGELRAALPPGTLAGPVSPPPVALPSGATPGTLGGNVNTRFILAFAILGLVLAVLITANVVSAAVIASYRRIGVLKSIGFTPGQVTAVYLAQISIPAVAGAVVGTTLGNQWVLPVINLYPVQGERVFVPLWINLTVPLGMLALAVGAAAAPAVRAGRMPAVAAIIAGQAPRAGRGVAAFWLAARLGLPETVAAGLAAPFSRPARSAVTLAALTFGLAGVVLGTSLNTSIHKINHSAIHGLGQLQAAVSGQSATLSPHAEATTEAAIRAQPGTQHYVGEADLLYGGSLGGGDAENELPVTPVNAGVAAEPDLPVMTYAYNGDSSWLGWSLVSGHWYNGPGQIDVSTIFATATGKKTGDSITLTIRAKPVTVRIAGEVYIPTGTPAIWTSWQTMGDQGGGLDAHQYDIGLTPGTNVVAYTAALQRRLGPDIVVGSQGATSFAGFLDTSLFSWLTVLVAMLAALGVFNAALMATRERLHDLGVFKAVGMTPRQTIMMVTCWVIAPAVIATVIAMPTALIIQTMLIGQLANSPGSGLVTPTRSIPMRLPGSFVHVLGAADLLLLVLAGLAIAIAGALGPASWAARTSTSTVLRTE